MFGKKEIEEEEIKRKHVERFYILLSTLMNELFEYAPKSGYLKMPYNVSFGLIHDKADAILLKGTDKKTGKTLYLYNIRIIGKMFEERKEQMLKDSTTNTLFSWIGDVCSLYIRPFVHEYVVNIQHRGEGAAERTTRQIVRRFTVSVTSRLPLNNPLPEIEISNLGIPTSTDRIRWPVLFPLLSKISSPNIQVSYQTDSLTNSPH